MQTCNIRDRGLQGQNGFLDDGWPFKAEKRAWPRKDRAGAGTAQMQTWTGRIKVVQCLSCSHWPSLVGLGIHGKTKQRCKVCKWKILCVLNIEDLLATVWAANFRGTKLEAVQRPFKWKIKRIWMKTIDMCFFFFHRGYTWYVEEIESGNFSSQDVGDEVVGRLPDFWLGTWCHQTGSRKKSGFKGGCGSFRTSSSELSGPRMTFWVTLSTKDGWHRGTELGTRGKCWRPGSPRCQGEKQTISSLVAERSGEEKTGECPRDVESRMHEGPQ